MKTTLLTALLMAAGLSMTTTAFAEHTPGHSSGASATSAPAAAANRAAIENRGALGLRSKADFEAHCTVYPKECARVKEQQKASNVTPGAEYKPRQGAKKEASPEERKAMMEEHKARFQAKCAENPAKCEEMKARMEKMKSMSPEERQKMRDQHSASGEGQRK